MDDRTFLSIRMNREAHEKLKYIAEYEGRSMSRQITYLILSNIREFEREHGTIELSRTEE